MTAIISLCIQFILIVGSVVVCFYYWDIILAMVYLIPQFSKFVGFLILAIISRLCTFIKICSILKRLISLKWSVNDYTEDPPDCDCDPPDCDCDPPESIWDPPPDCESDDDPSTGRRMTSNPSTGWMRFQSVMRVGLSYVQNPGLQNKHRAMY